MTGCECLAILFLSDEAALPALTVDYQCVTSRNVQRSCTETCTKPALPRREGGTWAWNGGG